MSGLVERVKGVVRSRSKHRHTDSTDSTGRRNSNDQYVLAPETSQTNARSSMQENRRGRVSDHQNGLDGTTRSLAAMNMNDPYTTTTTTTTTSGTQVKTLPPLPNNAVQNIETARAQNGTSNSQYQNSNMAAPRTPTHQRNISSANGGFGSRNISPDVVSDGSSSMKRKPLPSSSAAGTESMDRNGIGHPKGPRSPPGHQHTRSTDIAPNDPSPLVPHFTTRSAASPTSPRFPTNNGSNDVTGEVREKDLRLPANFDLNNTERTYVETKVAPAVTAEKVHIQRTEIITKAIHRDVHIDHHYTYVQPIPVLEVLPARHFRLDPTTGVKTEIPAPPDYKLPAHLEPRPAEDYSHLRKSTRHYVVDEDHPNGQLEDLPLRHKEDVSDLHGQQNASQNGTNQF